MNSVTFERFNILIYKHLPKQSTKEIKKLFGDKELVGAEIGTEKGLNSESILKTLNIKKLYLIDPYVEYKDVAHDFLHDKESVNENLLEAKKRVERFGDKVKFIIKTSDEAHKEIKDNSLDFVYIDGLHDYEFVKRDIENYWKKLKKGGLLSGHDMGREDVNRAVWEFSIKINKFFMTGGLDDWWIIK